LLDTHAAGVSALLTAYDTLARQVAGHPDRFVVTHGEPHAGNVLLTRRGPVLVDWDTVLAAPPERDEVPVRTLSPRANELGQRSTGWWASAARRQVEVGRL
jgi:aminoglycoside phosphotransferase (APT) family kinase protein